jgi:hypothetical protein
LDLRDSVLNRLFQRVCSRAIAYAIRFLSRTTNLRQQLIEIALLDHNVFADDEPVRRHITQPWENSRNMLFEINKDNYYGQVSACVHEARRVHSIPPVETRDRVKGTRTGHILLPQELKYLRIQRFVMPLI